MHRDQPHQCQCHRCQPPLAWSGRVEAGLLSIVEQCIERLERGPHGLDGLKHRLESFLHQFEPPNRLRGLYGAAKAAQEAGQLEKAATGSCHWATLFRSGPMHRKRPPPGRLDTSALAAPSPSRKRALGSSGRPCRNPGKRARSPRASRARVPSWRRSPGPFPPPRGPASGRRQRAAILTGWDGG
jgi:hypothetical protein